MTAGHPYSLGSYLNAVHEESANGKAKYFDRYQNSIVSGCEWIIDSGLFSMMFGRHKDKTFSKQDLLKYTDTYLKTMQQYDYRSVLVEMDVHKVLGVQHLHDFRKLFEDRWGVERTMFVWHLEEGIEGWCKLAATYPYIAISIPELRKLKRGKSQLMLKQMVTDLIHRALQINPKVKIHLLGCTEIPLLHLKGYYSCDSSSWLYVMSFAIGYIYKDGRIVQCHKDSPLYTHAYGEKRPELLKRYRKLSGRAKTDRTLEYDLQGAMNALQYSKLNKYINRKFYDNEEVKSI
jgi:hypothetical protein